MNLLTNEEIKEEMIRLDFEDVDVKTHGYAGVKRIPLYFVTEVYVDSKKSVGCLKKRTIRALNQLVCCIESKIEKLESEVTDE